MNGHVTVEGECAYMSLAKRGVVTIDWGNGHTAHYYTTT